VSVNWFADDFGGRVHVAPSCPDAHDASEAEAERRFA
jgi:hypothetical protein